MSKTKEQTHPKKERKPKSPKLRNKAYKFRIYPTHKQIGKMEWTLRRCKELYNAGATSTYLLTLSEAVDSAVHW